MKQLDLINEFRALSAQLKTEVESASAMCLYDTHKVAENLMCKLLSELCGHRNLRNLNRDKDNYPGIDLADAIRSKFDAMGFLVFSSMSSRACAT